MICENLNENSKCSRNNRFLRLCQTLVYVLSLLEKDEIQMNTFSLQLSLSIIQIPYKTILGTNVTFSSWQRITLFCHILSIKIWSISLHKCHISLLFCGRLDLVQKWQGHWSWSRSQIRNLVNQNHLIFHVTGPTSADFGSFPESGKARWESWIYNTMICGKVSKRH